MRKYKWDDFVRCLERYKITVLYTVPSIFLRISKAPEITDHFKDLIGASTGAAPMDGELQKAANAKLGDGKQAMIGQTWGLSETTGAVTAMPKGESDDTGSISPILPCVELRIVDEAYNDVEPGDEGELLVRSPLVTNGYYKNDEATRAAFRDGWFCTGDIGVMRSGKFYIVDRKKVSFFPGDELLIQLTACCFAGASQIQRITSSPSRNREPTIYASQDSRGSCSWCACARGSGNRSASRLCCSRPTWCHIGG